MQRPRLPSEVGLIFDAAVLFYFFVSLWCFFSFVDIFSPRARPLTLVMRRLWWMFGVPSFFIFFSGPSRIGFSFFLPLFLGVGFETSRRSSEVWEWVLRSRTFEPSCRRW